jgi:serine/threonine-protein kinase HipA
MKKAKIYIYNKWAGTLNEDQEGFHFQYESSYLLDSESEAISLTLPIRNEAYKSQSIFPFFDGLIPEGWLLDIAEQNWKINPRDRMSLLLATCKDCIGAVSVHILEEDR